MPSPIRCPAEVHTCQCSEVRKLETSLRSDIFPGIGKCRILLWQEFVESGLPSELGKPEKMGSSWRWAVCPWTDTGMDTRAGDKQWVRRHVFWLASLPKRIYQPLRTSLAYGGDEKKRNSELCLSMRSRHISGDSGPTQAPRIL